MKAPALTAAVVCVTVVAALAAPRASNPAYQYGLTGNDWWAGLSQKTAAAAPVGPRAFRYGLTNNAWWAAQARKQPQRSDPDAPRE